MMDAAADYTATSTGVADRRQEQIALVLGAGGARGLAQIGVIEVLQAHGLKVVSVSGSSAGALVGGLFAAGKLGDYRDWLLGLTRAQMLRLFDPGFGRPALSRGDRLMAALREVAGSPRIEELPVDFTAVAVDLVRQREVWLREGDLWDAVRASIAIPGVFTPYVLHGRTLVDGGLLAPLPIAATRLSGARHLVAVDMHSRSRRRWPREPDDNASEPLQALAEGGEGAVSPWRRRIGRWLGQHVDDEGASNGPLQATLQSLGFSELMARSLDTMQAQIARTQLALDPPELVIHIPRDAAQFYEFWRAEELIELGRSEAEKVLAAAGY